MMEEKPLYLLVAGLVTGAISLADIDLILAVILKIAAIISILISVTMTIVTKWEDARKQVKEWFK